MRGKKTEGQSKKIPTFSNHKKSSLRARSKGTSLLFKAKSVTKRTISCDVIKPRGPRRQGKVIYPGRKARNNVEKGRIEE